MSVPKNNLGNMLAYFNEFEEFRDVNKQKMHYLESIECDSCKAIDNLIDACVEFHRNDHDDYYVDENVYSCNSLLDVLALASIKKFTRATNTRF